MGLQKQSIFQVSHAKKKFQQEILNKQQKPEFAPTAVHVHLATTNYFSKVIVKCNLDRHNY